METKMPYYMTYPLPVLFDEEKAERQDYEYLRSMYPDMAKRILPYVEDECDRYEYDESMIYDEYPDKLQLRLMARRIFDNVKRENMDAERVTAQERSQRIDDHHLRDLVEILLFQELMKRRNDRRRRKKRIIW